jgi:hypothetical protein
MVEEKSMPSWSASTSMVVSTGKDSILFALSRAVLNRLRAFLFTSKKRPIPIYISAWINVQERYIKGTTAKIEDEHHPPHITYGHLVKAIGKGGGSGFVDDAQDIQSGDGASVDGGLALSVVEVDRDGDDRVLS